MKITGSYEFDAPAEIVWESLTNPEKLAGCIPGCEGLEPVGDEDYRFTSNDCPRPYGGSCAPASPYATVGGGAPSRPRVEQLAGTLLHESDR